MFPASYPMEVDDKMGADDIYIRSLRNIKIREKETVRKNDLKRIKEEDTQKASRKALKAGGIGNKSVTKDTVYYNGELYPQNNNTSREGRVLQIDIESR